MNITQIAINSFAKFLIGGDRFARVIATVKRVEDPDLSGRAKRELAIAQIEQIGIEIGGWLLNLAIELAVAYVRQKADSK